MASRKRDRSDQTNEQESCSTKQRPEPTRSLGSRCSLLVLTPEIQAYIFKFCDASVLTIAEQACTTFRGPRQVLSPIQHAVRSRLSSRFGSGTRLRVQSWPGLLSRVEAVAQQAQQPDSSTVHDLVFGQSAYNLLHQHGMRQLLATDHAHILGIYLHSQLSLLLEEANSAPPSHIANSAPPSHIAHSGDPAAEGEAEVVLQTARTKFAFGALRELANEKASADGVVDAGLLPLLSRLLLCCCPSTRQATAEVISSLAEHEALLIPLVQSGVLPGLVRALTAHRSSCGEQLATIRVLGKLGMQRAIVTALLSSGAVSGLLQAMSLDESVLKNAAANAMNKIVAMSDVTHVNVILNIRIRPGLSGLPMLIAHVRQGSRVTQRCAAIMVGNVVAIAPLHTEAAIEGGAPSALLSLLDSGTAELQHAAAVSIRYLCSHNSGCAAVVKAGGVKLLTRALRSESRLVQRPVTLSIGYIATLEPVHMDRSLGGLVQRLSQLLVRGQQQVQGAVVFALGALLNHQRHLDQVLQVPGVTEALLQMLANKQRDASNQGYVRQRLTRMLSKVVVLPNQAHIFVHCGGVALLMKELTSPGADGDEDAAAGASMYSVICVVSALSALEPKALLPEMHVLGQMLASTDAVCQYAAAKLAQRLPPEQRAKLNDRLLKIDTNDWRLQGCLDDLLGRDKERVPSGGVGCPWCGHPLVEVAHSVSGGSWVGCDVGLEWLPRNVNTMDCCNGCAFNCCIACWKCCT